MIFDAGTIAVLITVLLSLLGLATAWGVMIERVKNIRCDVDKERKDNREDHQLMFEKLDRIERSLNGARNGGQDS